MNDKMSFRGRLYNILVAYFGEVEACSLFCFFLYFDLDISHNS